MKRYETYKDSGVEWIGKIPANWQIGKLKYFTADVPYPIVDGPFGTQLKANEYQESGVPLVRISNLDYKGCLSLNNIKYVSESKAEEIKRSTIILNDLIIGKTGATIGKSGLNDKIEHGVISSSCLKISVDQEEIKPTFFKYYVTSDNFQEIVLQTASGSTRDTINITPMANLEVVVPSLQEQTQIANYLDYKTGLIDAIIAQKETLIKKLKEQRQAIINEAVTKGLNPDVKLKDSGIEWLGDIPEHWTIAKFKYFAKIKNGKDQKSVLVDDGKYPILGTGGEFGRASEFLYDKPSVLLGRKGTIDKPQFIEEPFWTVDTLFYTEIQEDVSPKYLFYLSTLIPFNLLQESSAVPSMTQDKLHNVFLIKPIKEEQNKIVKHIENEMNKMDLLISKAKESIQKLKEYRQSLISEAVTGKIDVRDWQAPKS